MCVNSEERNVEGESQVLYGSLRSRACSFCTL